MLNLFKSYTNTVRQLLQADNLELCKYFSDSNLEEVFESHDNWNGGIDFYSIILNIPVGMFTALEKSGILGETEDKVLKCYNKAMRGEGESLQINNVYLRPSADDTKYYSESVDDSMWKPSTFRLFISHVSKYKGSATNLKQCIANYGIDCFVAHEDITPSKEWEIEIEKALFSMDALCAIIVPEFAKSNWCDQEVGIALGQHKLVIPIDKGAVPYGFFGKYQALKSHNKNANEMADDIWRTIATNDRTKSLYLNKLVALILNSTNEENALRYLGVIEKVPNLDKYYIENIHNNYNSNSLLMLSNVLEKANTIFKSYGLSEISENIAMPKPIVDDDLPF